MREFCVDDEQLAKLVAAPITTRIANGPLDHPIHFVKTGVDEWRPCDFDGKPYVATNGLPWDGPFESAQIHSYGLRFVDPCLCGKPRAADNTLYCDDCLEASEHEGDET